MTPSRPISVLIVDDSAVARASLGRIIDSCDDLVLAATATRADHAIAWLRQNNVDIVLLDLEMPGQGGLAALPELIDAGRGAQILIVSSTAREGAEATVRALALGAADTLAKPSAGLLNQTFGISLIDRVRRLGRAVEQEQRETNIVLRPAVAFPVALLAIGASTGGLRALAEFFAHLPARFDAPIFVTQHLPDAFMNYFAEQLGASAGRFARVARDGDLAIAGDILVAPGTAHMTIERVGQNLRIKLSTSQTVSRCCPSIDPMLASAADAAGQSAVAVILTGMGRDGEVGARHIVQRGGSVIAQDKASSAVWGMPGTVVKSGLASVVGNPTTLAKHLMMRGSS